MTDAAMYDVDPEHLDYDWSAAIDSGVDRCNQVWDDFLTYARIVEERSDAYVRKISQDTSNPSALEKVKGLADWVRRTKGSYESKLFEIEAMLDHVQDGAADGYLGYDTDVQPDVSIMNRKSGKYVAIEMKQVESMDPDKVHTRLYEAIDQLLKRVHYTDGTLYTHWKAYIYVNPGNSWPFPTEQAQQGYDPPTYKARIMNRKDLQEKSSHWKAWKKDRPGSTLTVVIKHGDYGRVDYVLGG